MSAENPACRRAENQISKELQRRLSILTIRGGIRAVEHHERGNAARQVIVLGLVLGLELADRKPIDARVEIVERPMGNGRIAGSARADVMVVSVAARSLDPGPGHIRRVGTLRDGVRAATGRADQPHGVGDDDALVAAVFGLNSSDPFSLPFPYRPLFPTLFPTFSL